MQIWIFSNNISKYYDKLETFKDCYLYKRSQYQQQQQLQQHSFYCLRSCLIFKTRLSLMLFVLRYLIMKSAVCLRPLNFMFVFASLTQTQPLHIDRSNVRVFDVMIWTLFSCINSGASSYQIINCLMHFVKVTSRPTNK